MGQDPLVTLSNSWTRWWEIHFCSTQSIFNLVSAIVWHFNRQVYPRAVTSFHWAQSLGLGEADDNIYYARLFRVGLQVWHVWHLLYQTSKTYWMWLLMVRITSLRVFVESFLPILFHLPKPAFPPFYLFFYCIWLKKSIKLQSSSTWFKYHFSRAWDSVWSYTIGCGS